MRDVREFTICGFYIPALVNTDQSWRMDASSEEIAQYEEFSSILATHDVASVADTPYWGVCAISRLWAMVYEVTFSGRLQS